MRQVHVNLKPKPTPLLKPEPAANFLKRKERSTMDVANDSPKSSNASTGAASEEIKYLSTDAQVTAPWNLEGKNRVHEILDMSETVSYRLEQTIDKIEKIDQRARILLGPARIAGNSFSYKK